MHFSVFDPKPKKPTQAPDGVVTKAARVGYLTNFLSRSGSGPCPAERAHGRTVAAISRTTD